MRDVSHVDFNNPESVRKDYDSCHVTSAEFQRLLSFAASEGLLHNILQSALTLEQLNSLKNEPIALRPLLKRRLQALFQRSFRKS